MRLLIIAAIAFVTGAFAGCIGGVGTISAMDGLEPATDAANALTGESLQFLGVGSLEPFRQFVDEEDDVEVNIHLDKTPGDGLAPGWIYTFAAGDDLILIGYASGLGVIFDARDGGALADEDVGEYVISGWKTDSDDAAAALAAHEMWPEMTDSSLVFWELMQHDECPVWSVEHIDAEDDDAFTVAQVDGCTGEVLGVNTERAGAFSCQSSFTSGSGTLVPMSGADHSLELPDGAYLQYVVSFGAAVGDASWTLTGPDGVLAQGSTDVNERMEMIAGGEYTLFVDAGIGAATYAAALEGGTC